MRRIITIQHTQSLQHTNGMIGSWRDWDLTGTGVEQAHCIGRRLSGEIQNERYTLYSSDLLRAGHTADIVAAYTGTVPIRTGLLREFNLGEAVGRSKVWARANAVCAVRPGTIDQAADIDGRPFTGAESQRDVWRRLSDFYTQYIAVNDDDLILVSHDGTLSIFFALWLGMEVEMLNHCRFSGCASGVSFLYEDSARCRGISRLNDLSYLR